MYPGFNLKLGYVLDIAGMLAILYLTRRFFEIFFVTLLKTFAIRYYVLRDDQLKLYLDELSNLFANPDSLNVWEVYLY